MNPKHPINPCIYDTYQTPPCLNLCLSSSKTTDKPNRGHASRINKHDNFLKVDINDKHKQEHQSITTPNNITNISKSEGGECLRKKQDQKLISNLVALKNHKAPDATTWK